MKDSLAIVSEEVSKRQRMPTWLRRPPGSAESTLNIKKLLRKSSLNTVCEEARCPNISECFGRGTATFMILGDICTRGCRFCSVHSGKPQMPSIDFEKEADSVATASSDLGLKHVVVTSVARDDLKDGGASGFVETIEKLREKNPGITIEVLVPDFRGNQESIEMIVRARPEVFNHNLETVPRLYRRVRPGAIYQRSLDLLELVKQLDPSIKTKTGIMLGLGEEECEVLALMQDAKDKGISIFTAGQYMQPARNYLEVKEYIKPERFKYYEQKAKEIGFKHVMISPLSRSSYRAEEHVY